MLYTLVLFISFTLSNGEVYFTKTISKGLSYERCHTTLTAETARKNLTIRGVCIPGNPE